jgi:hypothetical protein
MPLLKARLIDPVSELTQQMKPRYIFQAANDTLSIVQASVVEHCFPSELPVLNNKSVTYSIHIPEVGDR